VMGRENRSGPGTLRKIFFLNQQDISSSTCERYAPRNVAPLIFFLRKKSETDQRRVKRGCQV